MRRVEEPKVTEEARGGQKLTHPAFGQLILSKVSGSRHLYGSDFRHHNYVTIKLCQSEVTRDLSRDWPHATTQLFEIAMSEAQWATFVSSFGVGIGVQCTIDHIGGKTVPDFPLRDTRPIYKAEVDKKLADSITAVEETIAVMKEGLSGVSKKKRDEILGQLNKLVMELKHNIPFIAKSFGEHMEKHVEKGKVEINAYMQNVIMSAGLEHLLSQTPVIENDTNG